MDAKTLKEGMALLAAWDDCSGSTNQLLDWLWSHRAELIAGAEREVALTNILKKYIGWFALKDGVTVDEVLARELSDPEMTSDTAAIEGKTI